MPVKINWGPAVEVIQPKLLKQEILEQHKRSIENFSDICKKEI